MASQSTATTNLDENQVRIRGDEERNVTLVFVEFLQSSTGAIGVAVHVSPLFITLDWSEGWVYCALI